MPEGATELPHLRYYTPPPRPDPAPTVETDVCVYGATSAGIAAAVQLRRMGKGVALVDPGRRVGGLTTGGLGATDIGNKAAIGGIARQFYRRLGAHYGQDEMWTFEPRAASATYDAMLRDDGVEPRLHQPLAGIQKDGNRITSLRSESGATITAGAFIDATYEGDLLAAAGVSYAVGREPSAQYDEAYNGVFFGHPSHNFRLFVDPYVREGHPGSGLLWGISADEPGRQGDGDARVQAYNFRLCLTDVPDRRKPFPRPAGYDPGRYELLLRYLRAGIWDALRLNKRMPNGKTDLNNFGGFSTDHIGGATGGRRPVTPRARGSSRTTCATKRGCSGSCATTRGCPPPCARTPPGGGYRPTSSWRPGAGQRSCTCARRAAWFQAAS